MQLSEKQSRTLRAIGNTLIPSLEGNPMDFWQRKAQDLQLASRLVELIGLQSEEEQADFKLLLNLWASPFVSMVLLGKWTSFADLSPENKEKFLQKMAFSPVPDFRKGFQAIKKLICFLFYTITENDQPNPNWKAINYPGPFTPPPNLPKPIKPLVFEKDSELDCEFLIIGSGAGGGTLAKILTEKGKDVIVVDKGGYFNEADFAQKEAEATFNLYEQHGLLATTDASCTVFAGSCLGGGTVINWSASLRTPPHILEEWAKEHQNPHFLTPEYRQSQDRSDSLESAKSEIMGRKPKTQSVRQIDSTKYSGTKQ
jgi:GMC oxidoreductase